MTLIVLDIISFSAMNGISYLFRIEKEKRKTMKISYSRLGKIRPTDVE